MGNSIRLPEDYRIFAHLEDHLFSLSAGKNPVYGALFFVDYEGKLVAVAASRANSYSEADKIREAAGKVAKPCRIAEVHPFLTHGCFPCMSLPVYFSVQRNAVLYVGDNKPKPDFVRPVSSLSRNMVLEQMVDELKVELKKALTGTASPHISSSLATGRNYSRLHHSIIE